MKAAVIKKAILENIPSGSGIEVVDGIIHIIGDDSPFLYCLDHNLKLLQKIELFASEDFGSGRIPKKIKPDFECMTTLEINNNKYIFIAGSGSTEKRNNGYLIKLPTKYNKKYFVQHVSLKALYDLLQRTEEMRSCKLNLEAAATSKEHLILFNRANKIGKNLMFFFKLEEFLVYLTENPEMVPFPVCHAFDLPFIEGIPSGFSGAGYYDEKLFFCASVEDTSDVVLDGKVLGSFIGSVKVNDRIDYVRGGNNSLLNGILQSCLIEENGEPFLGKVESISVYEKDSDTKFIALAVTDDDLGGSELLMLEIDLEK